MLLVEEVEAKDGEDTENDEEEEASREPLLGDGCDDSTRNESEDFGIFVISTCVTLVIG